MEYEERHSDTWTESRFTVPDGGDGLTMEGSMALYGTPSAVLSALDLSSPARSRFMRDFPNQRSFREVIEPGAFTKSLAEHPDIVLHFNHDESKPPLGRTTAGTLRLVNEPTQVRVSADLPDSSWGRDIATSVRRGDISAVSFRMGRVLERWANEKLDDGYQGPVRHLQEIRLAREVSLVTFPAYATLASVRALAEEADIDPASLVAAFSTLTPEARLKTEERDALIAVINNHSEVPVIGTDEAQKMAQMRERLALVG